MGSFSLMHWGVVLLLVLLLFGAGKLPKVMGDLANGIKNFKAGLKDEEEGAAPGTDSKVLPNQPVPPAHPVSPAAADSGVKKDETART